jgi:HAD superfamily hydrolase (TIGR01484 family)
MKILVTDFDNTLFTNEYVENVKLVHDFTTKGNIFIIATGRPIYLLKPDIENYNIDYTFLICNDGAVIFDKNDNKIYEKNLDKDVAKEIFKHLENSGKFEKIYIDSITKFSLDFNDISNGIVALPLEREEAFKEADYITSKYPQVKSYVSSKWLNVLTKEVSKGNAIKLLAKINNWNINEIITIGDNKNDITMNKDFESYAIYGNDDLMKNTKYTVNNFKEMMVKII